MARALSRLGYCSRSAAQSLVAAGRVTVDGRRVSDPEAPVLPGTSRIVVDGVAVAAATPVHIMLNKPRGLTTSTRDEKGRDTVYACLEGSGLPWLGPVGRLDRASEGLLLLSNDPAWAARLTEPRNAVEKTYHVQVGCVLDAALVARLAAGVLADGEVLGARRVRILRSGSRNGWLEIVLDEGRNRQIRRMLAAAGVGVMRLLRVGIGPLVLGELGKAQWRHLTAAEVSALSSASG